MSKTIAQLMDKYLDDALNIAQISAVQLSDGIVRKTPTDTESAANSWTPSLNEPKTHNIQIGRGYERTKSKFEGPTNFKKYSSFKATGNVKTTDMTRHSVVEVTDKMKIGDVFYLSNGQPYISWLEYMKRDHKGKTIINQGEEGHMRSRTQLEWDNIVKNATSEVKNGN